MILFIPGSLELNESIAHSNLPDWVSLEYIPGAYEYIVINADKEAALLIGERTRKNLNLSFDLFLATFIYGYYQVKLDQKMFILKQPLDFIEIALFSEKDYITSIQKRKIVVNKFSGITKTMPYDIFIE